MTPSLAFSAALVGVWAVLAPHHFYDAFPLPGRGWVSMLGPYNEHLVRDVGGLYLALLVVSLWTAARPSRELARVCGAAWLASGVPHVIYHAGHLSMFPLIDRIGMIGSLAAIVIAAGCLLLSSRALQPRAAPPPDAS
jgi:hypothetical protein